MGDADASAAPPSEALKPEPGAVIVAKICSVDDWPASAPSAWVSRRAVGGFADLRQS
jgi:hypothetical protein